MAFSLGSTNLQVYADGADLGSIQAMAAEPFIKGFTTNPTLMRKAGVRNYYEFAHQALKLVGDKPISFEVFSDDPAVMHAQAREIASWGPNVFVKVPVTTTNGDFLGAIIRDLSHAKVQLNVTAVFTVGQVTQVVNYLDPQTSAIISIFAGRIADTGRDPVPYFLRARNLLNVGDKIKTLWASPRQVYDLVLASEVADIITVTPDLLKKAKELLGKDLEQYSRETVLMFYQDAQRAEYHLDPKIFG